MTRHERLRAIYETSETDDCVLFPYSFAGKGYATTWDGKRKLYAHRVMCEWAHGAAPFESAQAAHRCGVRACVNPRHLRWATPSENHADRIVHGTLGIPSLRRLSPDQVSDIRARLNAQEPQDSIARRHGVTQGTISHIRRGLTYWEPGYVPPPPVSPRRLTDEQVRDVRRRLAAGEYQHLIAASYGLTQNVVWLIKAGRTYRDVVTA